MNNAVIAERIKSVCKSKKIPISQVLNECQLTKSFVYDLEKRNASPSCEKIFKIAEYLNCSVDYLLGRTNISELPEKSVKGNNRFYQSFNGNVTYEGNVNNATADNIVINSTTPLQSEDLVNDDEYTDIIQHLESLERKKRLHALVDIRYLLEEDYELKKKINSNIINAVAEKITINNIANYILGNVVLCRFIVIFLFAISCMACIYDIFKISLTKVFPYISGETSLLNLSDLPFFSTVTFCTFLIFYSKEYHSLKCTVVSALLMAVVLILRVFSVDMELINDITIIPVSIVGISITLLLIFEKISIKNENYT